VADLTDRNPLFGANWTPLPQDVPWWPFPPAGADSVTAPEAMIGGFLQSRFDSTALRQEAYDVVVKDGGTTLGVGTFDLKALR
jgi:hypothetical protein